MEQEDFSGMPDAIPAAPEPGIGSPRRPRRPRTSGSASASSAEPIAASAPDPGSDPDTDPSVEEHALPPAVTAFLRQVPRRLVQGTSRGSVSRENLPRRADVEAVPALSAVAQEVWDLAVEEGRLRARTYRALDKLWCGPDEDPEPGLEGDCNALIAAESLRLTRGRANFEIRDAHHAVANFARCLELLEAGQFPGAWFPPMLRLTRRLPDEVQQGIDEIVSRWCLSVTPETFTRYLRALVRWAESLQQEDEELRSVERSVRVEEIGGGSSCMTLTGPTPEILSAARRLDVAAAAVQAAQRAALADGTEIPWDPDGQVAETGRVLGKGTLRFLLATRSEVDVDGVDVPTDRFRIVVTVPMLTLRGLSEAPGMLDGATPIPADLARAIAGGENLWYRVLTDPCTGTFLPLPAGTYRPTRPMLEHLRLRGPQCAVPGCDRSASLDAECDHIEEFLAGGPTAVENLHWLCWFHHQEKTAGLLDPERLEPAGRDPGGGVPPGRTRWLIGSPEGTHVVRDVVDDVDLVGTIALQELDEHYLAHGSKALCDEGCRHFGRSVPSRRPAAGAAPAAEPRPAGEALMPGENRDCRTSDRDDPGRVRYRRLWEAFREATARGRALGAPDGIDPQDLWGSAARRRRRRIRGSSGAESKDEDRPPF